ncbi:AI-2E family transporter [Ensifer sp. 4252]|uniref:AI-2E family transporter n=1 Tax=Ensifer sp. 4252 TaxID=3373915 RepID=UPI003D20DE83
MPAPEATASIETRITDLVRFGVVGLFAYWSLTLVAPFAIIGIWAAILAVAQYPLYRRLENMLGGRGKLAALLITLVNLSLIIGPLSALIFGSLDGAQVLFDKLKGSETLMPAPPESVRNWPVIGERIYNAWSLASNNLDAALNRFQPALLQAGSKALSVLASIGLGFVGFIASVIVTGFLFRPGLKIAEFTNVCAHRIAGERGQGFVRLATATIRNVARGVIGVAFIQTLLCALVLKLFAVPAAGLIAFVVLILCIVQIGPAPVFLPLILWGWMTMEFQAALLMTLLLVPIGLIDNIMKPILVARGLSTPMLVILVGVLGGTLAYGLIGLFLGPIVLSVFYDLLAVWIRSDRVAVPAEQGLAREGSGVVSRADSGIQG